MALVLSGGGAKGAYEVGVLRRFCEDAPPGGSGWSVLTGASIGAMNAAALAQFKRAEQCTAGLEMLTAYWRSIKTLDDVMVAEKGYSCFSVMAPVTMGNNFFYKGAICDPAPGYANYRARVNASAIHASGVELAVVASGLSTGTAEWFSGTDPDIVDGALASGAIAPIVFPHYIGGRRGQWFVDGGLFDNSPILEALRRGAGEAVVITLDVSSADPAVTNATFKAGEAGQAVIEYYLSVGEQDFFFSAELRSACLDFPEAKVQGLIPSETPGSLLGFTAADIEATMQLVWQIYI